VFIENCKQTIPIIDQTIAQKNNAVFYATSIQVPFLLKNCENQVGDVVEALKVV
jgi:hypothetical protein